MKDGKGKAFHLQDLSGLVLNYNIVLLKKKKNINQMSDGNLKVSAKNTQYLSF